MLALVEDFLEMMVTHAQHHVGIHGDETAIGIVGEARVAGLLRQRYQGFVVEAEVEHRIHHPGHGCARAGPSAYPASVDSIPTSANQEDHVSMAAHGARRLAAMAENAAKVVAIELIAG